jgi:phage/plasmid-associated DNA primase
MYSIQYNTCQPNPMNAQILNPEISQVDHLDSVMYKNISSNGGSHKYAIDNAPKENILVRIQTTSGQKWGSMKPNTFLEKIKSNNGIYETLHRFPHKVYFDIDDKSGTVTDFERFTADSLSVLEEYFPNGDPAISGSFFAEKSSLHITFNNYMISNVEDRAFMEKLVKYIIQKKLPSCDHGVYTKNRFIKCINQSKLDNRVQSVISNNNERKHIISHFFNEPENILPLPTLEFEDADIVKKVKASSRVEAISSLTNPAVHVEVLEGETFYKEYNKMEFFIQNGCKIALNDCDHLDLLKVGYAFQNVFGEKGLDLFLQISKNDNFDYDLEYDTNRYLTEFSKSSENVSLGSVYYFFSKTNESHYKRILNMYFKTQCKKLDSEPFSSAFMADIFKCWYSDTFVFSDEKLYHYNGVYWEIDDKNNSRLVMFIDKVFIPELMKLIKPLLKKYDDLMEENKQSVDKLKECEELRENFGKTVAKIYSMKNVVVRQSIVKDITVWLTDNSIEFDMNNHLFAFENKIYDLDAGIFIEACPEHYISNTCGYAYEDAYDSNQVTILTDILHSIFPDEKVLEYYLSILATGLSGKQMENLFIATGEGGNGKSLINSLMLETTGKYGYKLPSTALTQPIKDGANPQMVQLHNKRFVLTQEPDRNKRQCCSTIKEITGDSTLNVRDNYSSKCGINLRLTLIQECNDKPKLDETGNAMVRRIRVVPFVSSAVNKEDFDQLDSTDGYILANPFYKTDEFKIKFKQALFEILKIRYTSFKNNNYALPETPQKCKDCSAEYMATSDDLFTWFKDSWKLDKNSKAVVDIKTIFTGFKSSEYYSNLSKVDKRSYNLEYFRKTIEKNIFIKKYIKRRDDVFNGVQIKKKSVLIHWVQIEIDDDGENDDDES